MLVFEFNLELELEFEFSLEFELKLEVDVGRETLGLEDWLIFVCCGLVILYWTVSNFFDLY